MAAAKKKPEEPLFVGVPEATSVRSNILESSKDLLLVLKTLDKIQKLRKEKIKHSAEVDSKLKSIRLNLNKLNKKLPNLIHEGVEAIKPKPAEVKVPVDKAAPKVTRQKTELDKIEEEISFIEKKLKQI